MSQFDWVNSEEADTYTQGRRSFKTSCIGAVTFSGKINPIVSHCNLWVVQATPGMFKSKKNKDLAKSVEAAPGVEPRYTDLQSAA